MLSSDNSSLIFYFFAGAALLQFLRNTFGSHNLRSIPTVGGPSTPLLSYISAFNYVRNGRTILQEGYDKYKGGMFKVPMLDRWLVVVTGPQLMDELQKLPDDKASFTEASGALSSTRHIFGPEIHDNPYYIAVIRQQLTRHLVSIFPAILDEVTTAFGDLIPATSDGWIGIPTAAVIKQIVARVSSRIFLGLPYCRNTDYLALAINVTADFSKARTIVGLFPPFLKPLVARAMTNIDQRVQTCTQHLHELIYGRLRDIEKFGDEWTDKPNDLLQWLIDEEKKSGKIDVKNIVRMLLLIDIAAIHTSSSSFVHALYHLAASPEYMVPLREEAEAVIQTEGWTKSAMGKMRRLDSFMRESQRMNGMNGISLKRMILKDVKFSNGITIPAGTVVVAVATATHMDAENYTNPELFDPWRFSNLREEEDGALKHQFVSTSVDYVSFGHGKHACPGRFFAANELKLMMAHIIMNYDVKFKDEGMRPPNQWFGLSLVPDPTTRVLFKKRSRD